MIFLEKPENWNPNFDIVSCFVIVDNKFVVLKRLENKSEGGKWGIPAGKKDITDKSLVEAVNREVFEETGLELDISNADFQKSVFVRYDSGIDFAFHMFTKYLDSMPEIKISPSESSEFRWIEPLESLKLHSVTDFDGCVKLIFQI